MVRTGAALGCLLIFAAAAPAADVKGKVVKVDAAKRTIVVETTKGKQEFKVSTDAKILGSLGVASKDGLKDRRLVEGVNVTLKVDAAGKEASEIKLGAASTTAPKTDAKSKPSKKVMDSDDSEVGDPTKRTVGKSDPKAKPKDRTFAKGKRAQRVRPTNGVDAKVVKVDIEGKTATVALEDGKRKEIVINDDTKFIGPRGGVSDDKIKDDRFVAGAEVVLVMARDGKAAAEVHLPFRPRQPRDAKKEGGAKRKPKAE